MTSATSLKAAFLASTIIGLMSTAAAAQQAAPPAQAADASANQLDDIVVTARKREENLQQVPVTITAFTAAAVERAGIKSVQDVIKFTPGLNYDKGFTPQDTRISIRGLPVLRGKPPVGVLLDGVDISSESISSAGGSALVNVKLVDVENIAVVKGPQNVLYGRSAFGGAVVYTSKKPNLDKVEGSAQVDIASYNSYEVRGAISIPVVQDKLAIRINAIYSNFDGFYRNTVTNNVIGGDELAGASVAIRFKPTETVDFTFRTSYSDDKSEARPSYYFGTNNGLITNRALPANAVGLRLGTNATNAPLPASWPFSPIGTINVSGNKINLSADPLTGKDFAGGRLRPLVNNLSGTIDLGFAKLSSWTGYLTAKSSSRADADFYGVPATTVTLPTAGVAEPLNGFFISDIKVKAKQFSQELRLGDDSGRFKWAVGGLYWMERYTSDNSTLSVAASQAKPAGTSVARAYQMLGDAPRSRSERNTDHYSGYATLTYEIFRHLEVTAEARYAHEKVDSVFGTALNMLFNSAGQPYYQFSATPINPTPTYSTNMFTPRAVVKYDIDSTKNIYASFSKGLKPGGYLNVGVISDTRLVRYNPEKLYSYEAGFKTTWLDNRLRVNGSYFHMINKDRLVQILTYDPTSPNGTSTSTANIGQVNIDGVELEVAAALGHGLTASASYSYVNARYTSSDAPQTTASGIAGPGNCAVTTIGLQTVCVTNTNGNQLDFNAKHSLIGSLNYQTDVYKDWNFNASLDFQMRSKRYIDANNLYALPSYWNFDLKAGVENGSTSIMLYVNNLFNNLKPKSAQTGPDLYAAVPPYSIYTAYAADKRQIGVRISRKF